MTPTFCSRSVTEPSQDRTLFSSTLVRSCVCLLAKIKQDYVEITSPIFTKFSGKASHGPMKKRLDFVDNPDLDQNPGIF